MDRLKDRTGEDRDEAGEIDRLLHFRSTVEFLPKQEFYEGPTVRTNAPAIVYDEGKENPQRVEVVVDIREGDFC